jgi:hypothetical protein
LYDHILQKQQLPRDLGVSVGTIHSRDLHANLGVDVHPKLTHVNWLPCLKNRQEKQGVITVGMLAKIKRMHRRDGLSLRETARRTGLSRNTIRDWLRQADVVEPKYPKRGPASWATHNEDWSVPHSLLSSASIIPHQQRVFIPDIAARAPAVTHIPVAGVTPFPLHEGRNLIRSFIAMSATLSSSRIMPGSPLCCG